MAIERAPGGARFFLCWHRHRSNQIDQFLNTGNVKIRTVAAFVLRERQVAELIVEVGSTNSRPLSVARARPSRYSLSSGVTGSTTL